MKNIKKVVNNPTLNIGEILIVEDSLTQATQLKHLLERNHYKVSVAQNGKEAINKLSKHKPSLVISDILMPETNGYELCKKIKSNKNTQNIPVILLTRLFDPEEIIEGLSCGADSFITKPYNEKHLLSNVEKFFSEGNKEDQKKVPFGVQILFKGKKRLVQAEQQNVIRLILDIYEGAILQNEKLIQTQGELKLLNDRLKSLIEDRTADLSEEIKLSNKMTANLKESEEKYRRIFENVQDLYYETSIDGTIINISPSIETLSNGQYHRDDLIGKSMYDFYADIDERATLISQIKEKRTVSDYEIILKNKDGSRIPCSVSSKIFFDAQGRPEKIIGSVRDITERKLADKKIRLLASRQETILSAIPNIIMEVDKNKVYTWSNKSGFEFFGEDVIGREANSFFLENQDTYKVIQPLFDSKEDELFVENWQRRQDGEKRFLSWWCRAIKDANGKVTGMLSSALDTTDRNQMQQALRESEEKFRSIMENSADAIFITDKLGKYIYTNKAVTAMLGFTPEEMQRKTILDLAPPDKTDEYLEVFKEVMSEGKIFIELELLKKDGSFISTDLNSVLLPGDLIYGSCRDITERKNAEEALRQSFAFNESLLKTIPFGMDIVSETGTVLFQSENFRRIFWEEAIGKKCWEIYRDNKKQCSDCPLIRGITVGETEVYESHGVLGNRIFEINHTGILYQGKKAMLEIFQDITDRKENERELIKAKEKAEESDRLKTAFLHNISHEIRTPMNAIVGFSALLGEPGIDALSQKSYIETIEQSSNNLLSIITDIIDISNIEANIVKIARNGINLNFAINSICNQFSLKAGEKKIKLDCESRLDDSEALVITDKTKLTQILTNLVSNSIKFTEEGNVKLSCRIVASFLEFNVSDTGIGIPVEHHSRIFERFYQVKDSMSRLYEGTGLGLAISKAYVDLLGGQIWFSSEPGKGTTFTFTIPYEKQTVTPQQLLERPAYEGFVFAEKKTILVAEDNDSNFMLINYFLSNSNTKLLRASNGKEAVRIALAEKNIDLILMDIKMPEMDGYTAVKLIREANIKIPIIAQTAYADDKEKAIEYGCSSLISKPFDKKTLLKAMSEFI